MLPGVGKLQKQMANVGVDDKSIARQVAIIQSMTAQERKTPKLLNASRKRRVASGSGTTAQEINRLIKQQMEMGRMMKKVGKMGGLKGLGGLLGASDPMQSDMGQAANLKIPEALINQPGQNFPGLPGLPKFPTKR